MPATRKRSAGGFLLGMFVGVLIGLAVSLGIAFYLNRRRSRSSPRSRSSRRRTRRGQGAGDRRPAAGRRRARPHRHAGEAEVRLLQILPGTEEPVTEKELRARAPAARGRQERRQSTGSLEGRLFHPGRLVPEPGRRRQPEGAPRDPRLRVERRAGEPARQGHLVPRAHGTLYQGRGDQQACARRWRRTASRPTWSRSRSQQ